MQYIGFCIRRFAITFLADLDALLCMLLSIDTSPSPQKRNYSKTLINKAPYNHWPQSANNQERDNPKVMILLSRTGSCSVKHVL